MPTKRGPARTSNTLKRKLRFRKKHTHHVTPVLIKELLDEATALLAKWLTNYDVVEVPTLADLEAKSVASEQIPYYLAFVKRVFSKCLSFSGSTLEDEKASLKQEFILRGLNSEVLDQLIGICQAKAAIIEASED